MLNCAVCETELQPLQKSCHVCGSMVETTLFSGTMPIVSDANDNAPPTPAACPSWAGSGVECRSIPDAPITGKGNPNADDEVSDTGDYAKRGEIIFGVHVREIEDF